MADIPQHVGYILDGNRRWAKSAGLASIKGHAKGQEVLREVLYA
ncbi:TPA: isoprenyl transferase, partial [Candidatus Saccharibacteria bacterium]|nr:isoprenyl transferase [Candidatus Saccharibacteria bacterium]